MSVAYTFGDSGLAARRLELLAATFAPTTEGFLRRRGPDAPGLAVDLGCGPGHTTELLRSTLNPARTIAVDSSPAYVELARRRLAGVALVVRGDVLDLPEQVDRVDVMFARLLLTHLSDPLHAVELWRERLSANGVLLLEEVESITTAEPAFQRYLELQRRMLEANGSRLEIGPLLDAALGGQPRACASEVARLAPPVADVARMFAMNFAVWRGRPEVVGVCTAGELDALADSLACLASADSGSTTIAWQLRQVTVRSKRR
jgi:SAM-dependent methyltransferase